MDGQPILFLKIAITATVCLEIPHVQFSSGQSVNHGPGLLHDLSYMVLLVPADPDILERFPEQEWPFCFIDLEQEDSLLRQ